MFLLNLLVSLSLITLLRGFEWVAGDPSQMLWNVARLDTCVAILDAREFPRLVQNS